MRAIFGLLLVLGTAVDAAAQVGELSVSCAAIDQETQDAFEARARAELTVRGTVGHLALTCDNGNDAQLIWTAEGDAPTQRTVPMADATADALFEAFIQLLGPSLATAPELSPVPPDEPEAQTPTAETPRSTPGQPLLVDRPDTPAPAPEPDQQAAPAATNTAQMREPLAVPATAPTRWSLGAALESWGDQVAVGGELKAVLPVWRNLSVSTGATLVQAATATEGFVTRNYFAAAGLRAEVWTGVSFSVSVLAGATQVQAPANFTLTQGANEPFCSIDVGDSGGLCGFVGGIAEAAYAFGSANLRPELAAQLGVARVVRAESNTSADGPSRTVEVPRFRPGLVLRVVWVPADPEREQ